jgi:hypothetical protein
MAQRAKLTIFVHAILEEFVLTAAIGVAPSR